MSLAKISLIACLSIAAASTAAWTLQRTEPRALARAGTAPTAQPVTSTEIPTIAVLANTRVAPGSDSETLSVIGAHFSKLTTVRIVAPDGKVFTFGSNALDEPTAQRFSLTTPLETPGTYFLMARNGAGTFSNAIRFQVAR